MWKASHRALSEGAVTIRSTYKQDTYEAQPISAQDFLHSASLKLRVTTQRHPEGTRRSVKSREWTASRRPNLRTPLRRSVRKMWVVYMMQAWNQFIYWLKKKRKKSCSLSQAEAAAESQTLRLSLRKYTTQRMKWTPARPYLVRYVFKGKPFGIQPECFWKERLQCMEDV